MYEIEIFIPISFTRVKRSYLDLDIYNLTKYLQIERKITPDYYNYQIKMLSIYINIATNLYFTILCIFCTFTFLERKLTSNYNPEYLYKYRKVRFIAYRNL